MNNFHILPAPPGGRRGTHYSLSGLCGSWAPLQYSRALAPSLNTADLGGDTHSERGRGKNLSEAIQLVEEPELNPRAPASQPEASLSLSGHLLCKSPTSAFHFCTDHSKVPCEMLYKIWLKRSVYVSFY